MENAIIESIKLFNSEEFGEIRAMVIENEPWFVGKDVAQALGYSDTADSLKKHVDDCDKRFVKVGDLPTLNISNYGAYLINESGLYGLIFNSKLDSAKRFKRWVTSEVLPSIRKNGGYIAGQEQLTPQELMAKALLVANKTLADREARISELTEQNSIMQPKADYFDDLVAWNVSTCFRATAKELRIPERKFIRTLIADGYVYRDKNKNLLPKAGKGDGLFAVKEYCNQKNKHGGVQTRVTPKGRETFRLLYADIRKN